MMMIAAWLIHCLFIATLLAAAAYAWEVAARWSGRAARFGWMFALAGTVALPWILRLLPAPPASLSLPSAVPAIMLQPMTVTVAATAAPSATWGARELGLVVWAALSVLMLLYVGALMLQLLHARRRWRETEVEGNRVWVSGDMGPAAVGLRHGMIVVPAWALTLDADLRSMLLQHEREHVRAGDPRLLLGGVLLVAAMPWNPLMWVLLLRLRNAIELDCDARVLASGANPQRYGSLLLEIGRRHSSSAFVMATFAEPRMFLEERIRRIARWPLQRSPARALALGGAALLLCATALSARDPLRWQQTTDTLLDTVRGEVPVELPPMVVDTPPNIPAQIAEKPTFTPMTVRPELLNTGEMTRVLIREYPPLLRDAGIGGSVITWFLIDTEGNVAKVLLSKTSGYPALDEAGLAVAQQMKFSPARNRDVTVPVWVEIPIVFSARSTNMTAEQRARIDDMARRGQAPAEIAPATVPPVRETPTNIRPELLNADEVREALTRAYPPLLKDAGISGVALVWFYVDENGRVTKTQISKSSGYPALDNAALSVAGVLRFRVMKDNQQVAAWVEIPLAFGDAAIAPARSSHPDIVNLETVRAPSPPGANKPGIIIERTPPERIPQPPAQAATAESASERPVFTPMTVRPELLNAAEVSRVLVRSYPPMLRDAGIGGTTTMWFFIDEDGKVVKTQLSKSSSYPALDEAAMAVANAMQFSPALNRDRKVAVWIEIPIVFTAK